VVERPRLGIKRLAIVATAPTSPVPVHCRWNVDAGLHARDSQFPSTWSRSGLPSRDVRPSLPVAGTPPRGCASHDSSPGPHCSGRDAPCRGTLSRDLLLSPRRTHASLTAASVRRKEMPVRPSCPIHTRSQGRRFEPSRGASPAAVIEVSRGLRLPVRGYPTMCGLFVQTRPAAPTRTPPCSLRCCFVFGLISRQTCSWATTVLARGEVREFFG